VALAEALDGYFLLFHLDQFAVADERVRRIVVFYDPYFAIETGIDNGESAIADVAVGADGKGLEDHLGCTFDIHS